MELIKFPERKDWPIIVRRPVIDPLQLEKQVRKILARVRQGGDKAVKKFTRDFDGVTVRKLAVSDKEIKEGIAKVDGELKAAILQAKENIKKFHPAIAPDEDLMETMPGIRCWKKIVPIDRVGLYIPGGTAPLFSTVLMLGIPAQSAGCAEVILCTPPQRDGSVHPGVLYTASLVGITKIFKAGGAQAIAAMAFGTETIPAVFKIFGPGNQYVNAAKQLVQLENVAIDMPAGPSEVCVLADESASAAFVAADLLSQAEHGPDSQVLLLSTSEKLIADTRIELEQQVLALPRKDTAIKALANSKAILLHSLEECMELANEYAPEHLIITCHNEEQLAATVRNAGSVFIGRYSPESAGDYASGTNHTLPTNGAANNYSGVSVRSFTKTISFQQLSSDGLAGIAKSIELMATAEGLEAHANAVRLRTNQQSEKNL